ncbi:MAG: hypothetical protein OXF98_10580 [Rhodospirillaceae bacterium]|nr:hypothetical protein [Rhodospirillaceae bacterium]
MANVHNRRPKFLSATADTVLVPARGFVTTSPCTPRHWRNSGKPLRLYVIASLAILISGCVTPLVYIEPPETWTAESSRVLLMPVDTRIHVITTGGTREERADWTEQSRTNLATALREDLSVREIHIVPYREFGATVPWDPDHAPMIKLHEIVSGAIIGARQLPTKRRLGDETGDLDYSLGETVLDIGNSYSADYALLVHVNASYASAGRAAVAIVAAIGGVSLQTNTQYAVASLIDLSDGSIVWFGTALGSEVDTRQESGAQSLVEGVLRELPL